MKNKKIFTILITLTLVLTGTFVTIAYSAKEKAFNNNDKVDKMIELKNSKTNSKTLAVVNGEEIKEKDVKVLIHLSSNTIDKQQALESIIRRKLLILEAKSIGLEASLESAISFSKENREKYNQLATDDDKKTQDKILKFLGISEDEYWNEYSVNHYRDLMTMGNLKEKIRIEAIQGINDISEQNKAYENSLNELIEELKIKYNVEILK